MKKTIAVLGASGVIGAAVADTLAKAGYHVLLAGYPAKRTILSMRSLRLLFRKKNENAPYTHVESVSSIREASWEADVILLAAPYDAHARVASKIKDVVTGKVVISMVSSKSAAHDDSIVSVAENLAQLLPHAKVISAFNTTDALNFTKTKIAGQTTDVFVVGDDEEGVSTAMELARDAGFNPILAGNLVMSRTLERMMALQTVISARNSYRGPIGWKVLHEKVNQDRVEQDTIK